jgi:hypothetical protein
MHGGGRVGILCSSPPGFKRQPLIDSFGLTEALIETGYAPARNKAFWSGGSRRPRYNLGHSDLGKDTGRDCSCAHGQARDGGRQDLAGRMERCGRSGGTRWARLYIKISEDFVYVAVQFPAGRSGFTDIYITSEDGGIYNLHASAKLGERRLDGGKWPEWSNWWEQPGVGGERSQVDSFEKRTFVPAGVREYQIERSRFVSREGRLMLDMSMESQGGKYTVVRFPASASDCNREKWLRVQFGP